LAAGTLDADGARSERVGAGAVGAVSMSSAGIGAAAPDGDDIGRAAAAGAGGIPASSEIVPRVAPVCSGCDGVRSETAADLSAGTASKKNPAPKDALIATATNPTSAKYSSVPTGIPTTAAARSLRGAVAGVASRLCSLLPGAAGTSGPAASEPTNG
jgi:hypothetical protein